ncbi:MAG: hypothetical protein JWR21_4072 [Herminiimonas sp.]|nr:hypothetical protein [Herminiimonas sp.]
MNTNSISRAYLFSVLTFAATAGANAGAPLPDTGRVYRESTEAGHIKFDPASGIEVIAQRINVCKRGSRLFGEGSTTGIDSYIVKTDVNGYFRLPPKTFSPCSYVVLSGMTITPYMHSVTGNIAKNPVVGNPALYGSLGDSDVILKDAAKGSDRVQELSNYLNLATGSYTVSDAMRSTLYSRYANEVCALYKRFPTEGAALFEKANAVLHNPC